MSAGARKPAWLQASVTAAKLDGGISETPLKKARGREVQFPFRLDRAREYASQSTKAKPRTLATKHDKPDNQRLYGSHGKAEQPQVPAKGGYGHKITSRGKDGLDGIEIVPVGATKPSLLRALAAGTVQGEVGARRGDGGAGMYLDDGVAAAARFAPGAKGHMPDDEAKAALESLMGAEVVRRVLEALRDNTDEEADQYDDNKEDPSGNSDDDGFVVTQDDNTEGNKTLGGEAPKVQ